MASKNDPYALEIQGRLTAHVETQMRERGLNRAAMARKLGVSLSNLGRMLTGERGMNAAFVLRVHRLLQIPGNILLDEDPVPRPRPPRRDGGILRP